MWILIMVRLCHVELGSEDWVLTTSSVHHDIAATPVLELARKGGDCTLLLISSQF